MARAKTLEEATRLLDPRPLDFSHPNPQGAKEASDPAFYAPKPGEKRPDGFAFPPPIDRIRKRLLSGTRNTKLFLSGHVGSGKSTELSRLAIDPQIAARFNVVSFRFEDQEWAVLDSSQILFRIAAELFEKHRDRLEKLGNWRKILKSLNDRVFEPVGMQIKESSTSVEVSAFIFKLRQDFKLSAGIRKQFRDYGETKQSVLQDLIRDLVDDIEEALTKEDGPNELLLIVDDLDKLRTEDQQRDVFDTNLSALLAPQLPVLYTVPTAVRFSDEVRAEIRQNAEDLFPVRVLKTAPDTWNPEDAYLDERIGFFQAVVGLRVDPGLIEPDAIRLAAIYAGGVLRDFFRLLREGVALAIYNEMTVLDGVAMRYAVEEERRRESIGLYAPDYEALVHIHHTGALRTVEDGRYLALARVLECWNGKVLFDAHPLLWFVLGEYDKKSHAQPVSA
jgi:KAP family P-loop domain